MTYAGNNRQAMLNSGKKISWRSLLEAGTIIATLVGLVATTFQIYQIKNNQNIAEEKLASQLINYVSLAAIFFIFLSFVLLSLFLFRSHRQRELETALSKSEKKMKKVSAILDELMGFFASFEQYLDQFLEDIPDTKILAIEETHGNFCKEANSYMTSILNSIGNLFSVFTGGESSVCLKLRGKLDSSSGVPVDAFHAENCDQIGTFFRDTRSAEKRTYDNNATLKIYAHSENTAFKTILDSPDSDFFGCDDVTVLVGYKNLNTNYQKYYKAVAVYGLRNPCNRLRNDPEKIIGFICVDNMHGNIANKVSERLLASISWNMYNCLRKLHITHRTLTSNTEIRYAIASINN